MPNTQKFLTFENTKCNNSPASHTCRAKTSNIRQIRNTKRNNSTASHTCRAKTLNIRQIRNTKRNHSTMSHTCCANNGNTPQIHNGNERPTVICCFSSSWPRHGFTHLLRCAQALGIRLIRSMKCKSCIVSHNCCAKA